MINTYHIPRLDHAVFNTLPKRAKAEIYAALRIFWCVDNAAHGERMQVWDVAIGEQNALLAAKGLPGTFTRQTLYNRRKTFHDAGKDWAVLVDKRQVTDWDPKERRRTGKLRGQPQAFRDYLFGLAMDQGRSSAQAVEELYRMWRAGDHIPGYGRWHSWFDAQYPDRPYPGVAPIPDGWGKNNLRRFLQDRTALELARRGVAAAKQTTTHIIRTRAGLRPMEYVVLDDWRADFLVFVPGYEEAVELNGILAMDVASASCMRFGVRPSLPQADGSHAGLKRMDTKCIVCELLLKYGYPVDYVCNIIVENGTATITPDDAAAIEMATNGQVKVHWTSMISGTVFGWKDKPVGNFRGKSWLESFFNLLHNACGNIPGQIGAHYSKRPARVAAMQKEAKALLKAEASLPAALRDTINYRMPFLDVDQARTALDFVFHFLNNRDDHALEGFDKVLKYRVQDTDPWRPVSILHEKGWTREMILGTKPRYILETPAERRTHQSKDVRFQRFPVSSSHLLIGEHRKVTIEKDGEVNIGSKSNPRYYRDPASPHLARGKKYLAFVSTQNDDWIHLTDLREGYVCSVARYDKIQHGDTDALSEQIADQVRLMNAKTRMVNSLDLKAPKRLADLEHNNRMLDEHLKTMELVTAPSIDIEADTPDAVMGVLHAERAIANHTAGSKTRKQAMRNFKGADLLDDNANEDDSDDYVTAEAPSALDPANLL